MYTVRAVTAADIPALNAIDMGYESNEAYRISRQAVGDAVTYQLELVSLPKPYYVDYDWDWQEAPGFLEHLQEGGVFGAFAAERCLGVVEMSGSAEGGALNICSLYVDRAHRGAGVGRSLVAAALTYAREQGARALLATTQAANVPAIRFYQSQGFAICGLHDHFYSNDDLARDEAAIFLAREV